jgi:hypothetical protein
MSVWGWVGGRVGGVCGWRNSVHLLRHTVRGGDAWSDVGAAPNKIDFDTHWRQLCLCIFLTSAQIRCHTLHCRRQYLNLSAS